MAFAHVSVGLLVLFLLISRLSLNIGNITPFAVIRVASIFFFTFIIWYLPLLITVLVFCLFCQADIYNFHVFKVINLFFYDFQILRHIWKIFLLLLVINFPFLSWSVFPFLFLSQGLFIYFLASCQQEAYFLISSTVSKTSLRFSLIHIHTFHVLFGNTCTVAFHL